MQLGDPQEASVARLRLRNIEILKNLDLSDNHPLSNGSDDIQIVEDTSNVADVAAVLTNDQPS
jgi:hypothetical protein